jgi:hypothetical protein
MTAFKVAMQLHAGRLCLTYTRFLFGVLVLVPTTTITTTFMICSRCNRQNRNGLLLQRLFMFLQLEPQVAIGILRRAHDNTRPPSERWRVGRDIQNSFKIRHELLKLERFLM